MNDGFYTPEELACDLIGLSQQTSPSRVADFSVGAGSLLKAARQSWPEAQIYGVDLNPEAIKEAESLLPDLEAFNVDFLSDEALNKTEELLGGIDLIVLNPPFTCRGSSYEVSEFQGEMIKCSKAMAFILRSCRYVKPNGEILAIVPRSCLLSQKDSEARKAISSSYNIDDLGPYQSPGFRKASVSVHLVRVTKFPQIAALPMNTRPSVEQIKPKHDYSLVFMRGSHSVTDSAVKAEGPSLIHTTDLFNSEISISRRRAVKYTKLVSGKVLMLPRVARPNLDKVAIGSFIQPVVPSDCILCVKTVPSGNEEHLLAQIRLFWGALKEAYSGTCASYMTMESFQDFASKLGYEAKLTSDQQIWNPKEDYLIEDQSLTIRLDA